MSNIASSIQYYQKIGFTVDSATQAPDDVAILRNKGGLELHMCLCDKSLDDDKNLLMDYPTKKYPGHTHMSFFVPNVEKTRQYLEAQGLVITGERKRDEKLFAVFTRDLDKTTIEYERNHGDPEDVEITGEMIGYPQSIDHIGIRVSNPVDRLLWYAKYLGFTKEVSTYLPDADPLKNGRPWITRSDSGIDINFIINANEQGVASTTVEGTYENALVAGGVVRPGIVVAAFTVADLQHAENRLHEAGINTVREVDLGKSKWSCLASKIVSISSGQSLFLEDDDKNIIRLLQKV